MPAKKLRQLLLLLVVVLGALPIVGFSFFRPAAAQSAKMLLPESTVVTQTPTIAGETQVISQTGGLDSIQIQTDNGVQTHMYEFFPGAQNKTIYEVFPWSFDSYRVYIAWPADGVMNITLSCPGETLKFFVEVREATMDVVTGCSLGIDLYNPTTDELIEITLNLVEPDPFQVNYQLLPGYGPEFGNEGGEFEVNLPSGSDAWLTTLDSGQPGSAWWHFNPLTGEETFGYGYTWTANVVAGVVVTTTTAFDVKFVIRFLAPDPSLHMVSICANEGALTGNCGETPFSYSFEVGGQSYGPYLSQTAIQPVWPLTMEEVITITLSSYADADGQWWMPLIPTNAIGGGKEITWFAPYAEANRVFLPIVTR